MIIQILFLYIYKAVKKTTKMLEFLTLTKNILENQEESFSVIVIQHMLVSCPMNKEGNKTKF